VLEDQEVQESLLLEHQQVLEFQQAPGTNTVIQPAPAGDVKWLHLQFLEH
jgi:hypothetical protein